MIYFEFSICRDPVLSDAAFDATTAEFMFDADNPGECTRRAAQLLRSRGWRAMSVNKALEAFSRDEFGTNQRMAALYNRAETGGIGYCLNTSETRELAIEEFA